MKKKDSRTKLGDIQNEENVSGNGILMKRNISWRDDDEDVDLELSPKNVMITFPNSGRRASYSISMDHLSKDPLKITDEDRENPTPFSACKLSDAEMLAKFLDDPENILDINEKDDNGWTLLMTASAVGAHACVELLLERRGGEPAGRDRADGAVLRGLRRAPGHRGRRCCWRGQPQHQGQRRYSTWSAFFQTLFQRRSKIVLFSSLKLLFQSGQENKLPPRGLVVLSRELIIWWKTAILFFILMQ
ncbi:unnamed protein product [Heterosigma akashiwo]